MVELPISYGENIRKSINEYRKKHNIEEPQEVQNFYNKNAKFLEEELEYLKELDVGKGMIPYLKYFPNVTKLNVDRKDSISDEDMKEIIQNCPNIQWIKF